ncbi:MAG TPA: 5-bromo-4-chloroindolyl phosphate hydrolysis family protein [Spirochaetia bacterium]
MEERKGSTVASIVAGVTGGVAFLIFWLLLEVPFVVSLLVGCAAFGAGILIFRGRRRTLTIDASGQTAGTREAALREGQEKLKRLQDLSVRIRDASVRGSFDAVVSAARRIMDDLKKNPKDIRAARQFLSYYLDATIAIVERYVDLSEKGLNAAEIQSTLRKVETMLGMIREAFEKQHARLLEDDVMDLDAEITLLKKTIEMEGLADGKEKT